MKTCKACEKQLADDAGKCPNCGHEQEKDAMGFVVVCMVLALVFAIGRAIFGALGLF